MVSRIQLTASAAWLALILIACGSQSNTGADDSTAADDDTTANGNDSGETTPGQDGPQGTTETDVGCGGANAPPCGDGKKCIVNLDCSSSRCVNDICQAPSSHDGVKNGSETDVDCGGSGNPPCDTQKACGAASDCTSGVCFGAVCAAPSSSDNVKNADETDVDCGGTTAPGCGAGKACNDTVDCESRVCITKVCQAPSSTDGTKNGTESDIDCGGGAPTNAPKCTVNQSCTAAGDCDQGVCTGNKCQAATSSDSVKNGSETDVDCGGGAPTNAPTCGTNGACLVAGDCDSGVCTANKCKAATSSDNVQNGTETDKDCGGGAPTNAPKCGSGKTCKVSSDCSSDGCNYLGKCAEAPSCTVHEGGDTCGRGEVSDPNRVHESCCATYPSPGNANLLISKYEITAGRMREFIRRTSGNVRGYIDTHPTSQIRTADKDFLPESNTLPTRTYNRCDANGGNCQSVTRGFGVYDHLGNTTFLPDRPCPNCGQGCYLGTIAQGAYAHPTYWWDATTQATQWSAQPRKFSQADLDVKSLNCVTQVLLAAFCKWDGGRLPTEAELSANSTASAWGTSSYPWGSATYVDTVAGAPGRVVYPAQANTYLVPAANDDGSTNLLAAMQYNYTNWNPFGSTLKYFRYVYPVMPSVNWDQTDQAFAIAAPGRMYNDRRNLGAGTLDGYFDVAGNIMEVTANQYSTDDANHSSLPRMRWVGGSFEGHNVGRAGNEGGNGSSILTKYGKMGGRCVYDKP